MLLIKNVDWYEVKNTHGKWFAI